MRNRRPAIVNVATPCVKVCRIDDDGYCMGCRRTLEEIRDWVTMSDYEKSKLKYELMSRNV